MSKYFDCLGCEYSQSIDGERLHCTLRNKEVNNHSSCIFQTEIEEKFPLVLELLKPEPKLIDSYKILPVDEFMEALVTHEKRIEQSNLERIRYLRDNFISFKNFIEEWENIHKTICDKEKSIWLFHSILQNGSLSYLEYTESQSLWQEFDNSVKFYKLLEREPLQDIHYYVLATEENPLCLIKEDEFDYEVHWFKKELYEQVMQKVYFLLATKFNFFPSEKLFTDECILPKFKTYTEGE